MNPYLIDKDHKDQRLGLCLRGHHHPPSCSLELVALGGVSPPFFLVEPIRAMVRQIVERLTKTPAAAFRYSRLSQSVTKGRSSRSAASNLLAFSSSLGFKPGLSFGASDSPLLAILDLGVTFDRRKANGEGAGSLAFVHTTFEYCFHDLFPEILRICIHPSMMPVGQLLCNPL